MVAGRSLAEIRDLVTMEEFSDYGGYDRWLDQNVVTMWDYLYRYREPSQRITEVETEPSSPYVDVQPGLYIAEIDLASAWHCKRFRIRKVESSPEQGRAIGSLDVDCGKAAFVDYDVFHAAVSEDLEAYESWTEMELDDELALNFSGKIEFGDTPLVYVKSGDGDGTYPAFELVDDGQVVGIECRFQ